MIIVQSPTPLFEQSLDFYRKLQFNEFSIGERHFFADKSNVVEINKERFARAGVKVSPPLWRDQLEEIKSMSSVIEIDQGHLCAAPSGVWIYLENDLLDFSSHIKDESNVVLGKGAGLSLESIDLDQSMRFWKFFGYEMTTGNPDQGWIVLTKNGLLPISIMKPMACPHLFYNPSLTYFNGGKNLPVIEKLKALRIPITEEITMFNKEGFVDNVIVRDPGGLGFFVFND